MKVNKTFFVEFYEYSEERFTTWGYALPTLKEVKHKVAWCVNLYRLTFITWNAETGEVVGERVLWKLH